MTSLPWIHLLPAHRVPLRRSNQLVNIAAMSVLARPAAAAKPRAKPARVTRVAERTQAAILDAATAEFARHGLGNARVDRIADTLGIKRP